VRFWNGFFVKIWTVRRAEIAQLTAKDFLPPAALEQTSE
jgi:hypothetical protein